MLSHSVVSHSFATSWTIGWTGRLFCPWDFPGKNTGVGLPFPPPGDLPDPGIKPVSLASPALADRFITTVPPGKPFLYLLFANTLVKTRYIKMTALGFKQPATYQGKT